MPRRYLRPQSFVGHVLVLAAALTCLRLGVWQWDVFHETRGTVQNLGYALLWPVFAGSFIYMWLRFLHLEDIREASEGEARDDEAQPTIEDVMAYNALREADALDPAPPAETSDDVRAADAERPAGPRRHTRSGSSADARTVGMGYVVFDDADDPELAAYNRALAQLADEDDNRAR